MQSTESTASTQSINELLMEVHIRISACLACAYGVISLFEKEMDDVTETVTAGLKFSIHDAQSAVERLEDYLS